MAYFALLLVILMSVTLGFTSPLSMNATSSLEPRVTHTGQGTWFNVGLGNCGYHNVDSDKIVALSLGMYHASDKCGQYVQITNTANGHTVHAMTRDSCGSCKYYDLDMSPAAFEALAPLSAGRIQISWHFMHRNWSPS